MVEKSEHRCISDPSGNDLFFLRHEQEYLRNASIRK